MLDDVRQAFSYVFALTATAVAVVLRSLLDPVMGDTLPLVTLFGAVAATVVIGGIAPAILTAVTGYAACSYLFIEPRGSVRLSTTQDIVGLAAYVFTCALIIAAGEAARRARARASDQREILQVTLASIGDAVITTDPRGRVRFLNDVAERLTGWSEEAVGQPLDQLAAAQHVEASVGDGWSRILPSRL